jgi:predicted small secreted protein
VLCVVFILAAVPLLAGSNTIQGAGKDLKRAGEKIEGAARNQARPTLV